jgi:hypothetical protein
MAATRVPDAHWTVTPAVTPPRDGKRAQERPRRDLGGADRATAHGDNTFTVKAVDRAGNTSEASNAFTAFLWPC